MTTSSEVMTGDEYFATRNTTGMSTYAWVVMVRTSCGTSPFMFLHLEENARHIADVMNADEKLETVNFPVKLG